MEIGSLINDVMHKRNLSVSEFARNLGCHRQNIYKIFEKTSVDTNLLMRISKTLNYDFFQEFSKELKKELGDNIK